MVSFNKVLSSASKSVTKVVPKGVVKVIPKPIAKSVSNGVAIVTKASELAPVKKIVQAPIKVADTVMKVPTTIVDTIKNSPKALGGAVGDIAGGLTKGVGSILPDKQTLVTYGGIALAGMYMINRFMK